jgi:uncharacterized protein YhbP (UPF0306 family)
MVFDIENTIRDYLPGVIHLSLATSRNNIPWICELHYVFDDDLHLYFRSTPERRHSHEITNNPKVSGNIISQHGLADNPVGVYFEGLCEMLSGVNSDSESYKLYTKRFSCGKEILIELDKPTGHQFYKISVYTYYVFINGQKYSLNWTK